MIKIIFTVFLLLLAHKVIADNIKIAVASNFSGAMTLIAQRFEQKTGHKVTLIFGASGKHYAQINHGAPFDAFFSADSKRPQLLDKEGIGLANSRFTYAIGKIILWSPRQELFSNFNSTNNNVKDSANNYANKKKSEILKKGNFRYLAIGNPKLAPYGRAAKQVLVKLGVWTDLLPRMVRGENIAQTFQFVKSANAELGFVALSQVKKPDQKIKGAYWLVPETFYSPIEQQAIILKDNQVTRDFFLFFLTKEVSDILYGFGYQPK